MLSENDARLLLAHNAFEHLLLARFYSHITDGKNPTIRELLQMARVDFFGVDYMPFSSASILGTLSFSLVQCGGILKDISSSKQPFSVLGLAFDQSVKIKQRKCLREMPLSKLKISDGVRHLRNIFAHMSEDLEIIGDNFRLTDIDKNNEVTFEITIHRHNLQNLLLRLQEFWLKDYITPHT